MEIMNEQIDWTDYPYIGLGEKPIKTNGHVNVPDELLEKLSY